MPTQDELIEAFKKEMQGYMLYNPLSNRDITYNTTKISISHINEDKEEDMNTQDNNMKKPLSEEEIRLGKCYDSPDNVLLRDNNEPYNKNHYAIGKLCSGNFNKERKSVFGDNKIYLILGFLVKGKVISKNSLFVNNKLPFKYILYRGADKEIELVDSNTFEARITSLGTDTIVKVLTSYFNYRLKSSEISGRVFGNGKIKAVMVENQECIVTNIIRGESKLVGETWYATLLNKERQMEYKFCISDLEIILPNIEGYNFPKDKTINRGSIVIVKETGIRYIVQTIYPNPTSKKISKRSETRQLDVLQLINPLNNTTSKIYAKNVKIIE